MDEASTSWAVVGAGLTGLVAAHRLAEAGQPVTVYERYPAAGGLVATFEVGGERLECFYHHLFTTDTDYLDLAGELGLAADIDWLPSRMGIYTAGRLWDFGTPASLLRFRPLPWLDTLRFALSTLYLRHRSDLAAFEAVTAREWIVRHAGHRVWEHVWGPLMRQKFAARADQVSMAWLWRKVYLRGRSRSLSGMGERLGYLRGSFGRLIDALVERLRAAGVELRFAAPVRRLTPTRGGVEVTVRGTTRVHPVVLFTGAPAELVAVAGDHLSAAHRATLEPLADTAALCMVLELDAPLTPYYWLNVADATVPFGGVIEHTNYVPRERYGGRCVVYLSKYLSRDDAMWSMREAELWQTYRPFLARLAPALEERRLLARHLFRAAHAQPIVPVDYSRRIPPFETSLPGLFHACMAQIYPEDRGQSYAVRTGNDAAARLLRLRGAPWR